MEAYEKKKEREEREQKEYLNRMKRTLNKQIQDNIFPQWRCHASLNGISFYSILRLELNELSFDPSEPKESIERA